jgi:hypothetical protein
MAGTNAGRYTVEYVYGDTDSVFFRFNFENPETGEFVFRVKPDMNYSLLLLIKNSLGKNCLPSRSMR